MIIFGRSSSSSPSSFHIFLFCSISFSRSEVRFFFDFVVSRYNHHWMRLVVIFPVLVLAFLCGLNLLFILDSIWLQRIIDNNIKLGVLQHSEYVKEFRIFISFAKPSLANKQSFGVIFLNSSVYMLFSVSDPTFCWIVIGSNFFYSVLLNQSFIYLMSSCCKIYERCRI